MLIPEFWADSRVQIKGHGKQITVRRSGWSMTSQAEAQAKADTRTRDTIQQAGYRILISIHGGHKGLALQRIRQFLEKNPTWSLRLYEPPTGLRLIATQRTFDAKDEAVQSLFNAICVDKMYARLCKNQNCFRARLTAKPWRIGLHGLKPRRAWPVSDDLRPSRCAWIEKYERKAAHFAACRFLETLGTAVIDADVRETIELHDQLSRALQPHLPIA